MRKQIQDIKSKLLKKRAQEEYAFWIGFVKGTNVSIETGNTFIDSKIEDLNSYSAFQKNLEYVRKLENKIKLCEKLLQKIFIGFFLILIIAVTSISLLIIYKFFPSYLTIFGSIGYFLMFAQLGILLFLWIKYHLILRLEDSIT